MRTIVVLDRETERAAWDAIKLFGRARKTLALSDLELRLQPVLIPNSRGLDWRGYGVVLVNKEGGTILLARNRKDEVLHEYLKRLLQLAPLRATRVDRTLVVTWYGMTRG